jgi:hypothetical protein
MSRIIKELHVLVGLPGSGKTTFTKQYEPTYLDAYSGVRRPNIKAKKHALIVDYDEIFRKVGFTDKLNINREKIANMPLPNIQYQYLILDGLFITQADVEWVIGLYLNDFQFKTQYTVEKIIVDVWKPDKEKCLWNDRARQDVRNCSSALSIRVMEPERIDIKAIEDRFGVKTKLELHDVVRAPAYKIMIAENDLYKVNGKYLESANWCLGGKSYHWSGSESYLPAEDPLNFDAFDELLEKICPQITYLQYKKIYAKCVTKEERSNCDYYTQAREGYWRCDLEKLYKMLEEMGLYHLDDGDPYDYDC